MASTPQKEGINKQDNATTQTTGAGTNVNQAITQDSAQTSNDRPNTENDTPTEAADAGTNSPNNLAPDTAPQPTEGSEPTNTRSAEQLAELQREAQLYLREWPKRNSRYMGTDINPPPGRREGTVVTPSNTQYAPKKRKGSKKEERTD